MWNYNPSDTQYEVLRKGFFWNFTSLFSKFEYMFFIIPQGEFVLTWTHCTGPVWSPLRTHTFWPFSLFQMWILPSLEPEMTNCESGEKEASRGSCLEFRWPAGGSVRHCLTETGEWYVSCIFTCECLKRCSIIWIYQFYNWAVSRDQDWFSIGGEFEPCPLDFLAISWK